jgi:DNA adenine methylase
MGQETSRYLSPLRYPGGKDRLATFITKLIEQQRPRPLIYVEPFAGGAGVGLRLLHNELVDEIVLNDLDPGVAAFWRAVFERTDELVALIQERKPTLAEWHRQHERHAQGGGDDVELGFATFFLNRTNRSGILSGRPIGGYGQNSRWGIAARYNVNELVGRVERLGRYRSRVTVCEADGVEVISAWSARPDVFIYADPPYLTAGTRLYMNRMTWADHIRLAAQLRRTGQWLLTYDEDSRVTEKLYPGFRHASFKIAHRASHHHVGREYAVFAHDLEVNSLVAIELSAN